MRTSGRATYRNRSKSREAVIEGLADNRPGAAAHVNPRPESGRPASFAKRKTALRHDRWRHARESLFHKRSDFSLVLTLQTKLLHRRVFSLTERTFEKQNRSMKTGNRAALYARVSTRDKGQDTENQLAQIAGIAIQRSEHLYYRVV